MVHLCLGEGGAHNFHLNSAIYTCGSCSVTFTTICTLHDHIMDYELGGSFYYDGFTNTAFPKHRTAIAETQTVCKDRRVARDIFRRFLDREFSGKRKYDRVTKYKKGNIVRAKHIHQLKKTVRDKRFHQLEQMCSNTSIGKDENPKCLIKHNQCLKAKKRNQSKAAIFSETYASLEDDSGVLENSLNEDEDSVDRYKTIGQPSTINETEYSSLDIPLFIQSENSPHEKQFKPTIVERNPDNDETTTSDLESQLRFTTKSEIDIDADQRVGEYSYNDNKESDIKYGDFLDEHENINDGERTCDLEEVQQDIMKQNKNEFQAIRTETTTKSNTENSVNRDYIMVKTESVIEPEKQKSTHTLYNAYVKLKRLESTHNDSETFKQENTKPTQFVAKMMEQRKTDMTLSKKTGRAKTKPLFDPFSRESKVDIEDKFFKRCAAHQTRLDEKRKETNQPEETKVAEKLTTTRNKPRKSYCYSSADEESENLNKEVLAMRKEGGGSLLAHIKVHPPPGEEVDPTFFPRKKKKKVNIRRDTDLKPKGKQKQIRPCNLPDNIEDSKKDDELEKIADGDINTAESVYTCNICQETMEVSMKTKHKAEHQRQRSVICFVCGISVQHRKLDDHIRTNHGTGETPFTCEKCGKELLTKTRLYRHRRSAHTVGKHKCSFCQKTFHSGTFARLHMKRYHTGERNHLCPHCGMAFVQVYDCEIHVNEVHLKIQRFECEICFRRFARKSNYRGHMETHAETRKTFECMYYNRKLLDKKSLRRHIQIHTGEKKNSCHLCDYSTIQRQCLAKHWATCHGLANEPIQVLMTEMKNKNKRKFTNDK